MEGIIFRKVRFLIAILTIAVGSTEKNSDKMQNISINNGDIIFVQGNSYISSMIRLYQTSFRYTHVGIAFRDGNSFTVLSSDFDEEKNINGVTVQELDEFTGSYKNILILHNSDLNISDLEIIKNNAYNLIGTKFDFYLRQNNKELYCTEFVALALQDSKISLSAKRNSDTRILTPEMLHNLLTESGWRVYPHH